MILNYVAFWQAVFCKSAIWSWKLRMAIVLFILSELIPDPFI
jgi:hypothetical protein